MVTIAFLFPVGRYHATPWDHHVNEGLVEWPPCSWRLLRSLICVWHRMNDPESQPRMRHLIDSLLTPPAYHIPVTSQGHTRHYMPTYKEKDKVFDAFHAVSPREPLVVIWPETVLELPEQHLLEEILSRMTYLGRAESWVQARLCGDHETVPAPNVIPHDDPDRSDSSIRLLVPQAGYHPNEQSADNGHPRTRRAKNKTTMPADIWEALLWGTDLLKESGWNMPPGSRWMDYVIAGKPENRTRHIQVQKPILPTVARFAVQSAVQPRVEKTLYLGEQLRLALMGRSRSDDGQTVPVVFSGKSPDGNALKRDHGHGFFIPEDADGDGFIDHFTVYAREGFDAGALRGIGSIRKLWGKGGHDIHVTLIGLGHPEELAGLDLHRAGSPVLGRSCVWTSVTPYFLTRHPKRHRTGALKFTEQGLWLDGPEDQLRKEIRQRQLPDPVSVAFFKEITIGGRMMLPYHFASNRNNGNHRPNTGGFFVTLTFAEPVQGPLCLGYACHYGLGQFIPATVSI